MVPAVIRTKAQGRVRLAGPSPLDPPDIEANLLAHPDDVKALAAAMEICREISNSTALRPFLKQEVAPGKIERSAMEDFLRDKAISWWHQSGTAKMGRELAVRRGQ